jgi:hypothetical protein
MMVAKCRWKGRYNEGKRYFSLGCFYSKCRVHEIKICKEAISSHVLHVYYEVLPDIIIHAYKTTLSGQFQYFPYFTDKAQKIPRTRFS